MIPYPEGGGVVGVANNDIFSAAPVPATGESQVSPELAKALMSKVKQYGRSAKPLKGGMSGIGAAAQQSIVPEAPGALSAGAGPAQLAAMLRK